MERKVELLAPAGDLEKLKVAINYGANAVYMGGKALGLRAKAKNFNFDEIYEAADYAHKNNARIYITANIFAHNDDFAGVEDYFAELGKAKVDALIISDPGIFSIARGVLPNTDIHISTQSNTTNHHTVNFWRKLGAKRVVLARELSFEEIAEINRNVEKFDPTFELESFVHGAMCISYSGRCLLSNYLTGRDSNKGECTHPCRWKYNLVEEQRPNEFMPVFEDERGTYIFNSKDLCMIGHLPKVIDAGVKSLKIEGRMKTSYYVAATTSIYRQALDQYFNDRDNYDSKVPYYLEELKKVSHRDFTTGFYFGKTTADDQVYSDSSYIRNYDFVGLVLDYDENTGLAKIEQRNKFSVGDEVDILQTKGNIVKQKISQLFDENMAEITDAPHPKQIIYVKTETALSPYDILRKKM